MKQSSVQRFWSRVATTDTCWLWLGRLDKDGYGSFHNRSGRSPIRAHRYSFELVNGPIPEAVLVCHSCDVPSCVNPDHLFLGTPLDNMADKCRKGRHISGMQVHPERAARGERVGTAKLREVDILNIRKHVEISQRAYARLLGVSRGAIADIRAGRTWAWL